MVTIYGTLKTLNFYDRLKTEFNFDIRKFATHERSTSDHMRQIPLFCPENLQDLFSEFKIVKVLTTQALSAEQLLSTVMTQPRRNPNLKFVNILDPCLSSNNLGKSISLFNAHRLREALKL